MLYKQHTNTFRSFKLIQRHAQTLKYNMYTTRYTLCKHTHTANVPTFCGLMEDLQLWGSKSQYETHQQTDVCMSIPQTTQTLELCLIKGVVNVYIGQHICILGTHRYPIYTGWCNCWNSLQTNPLVGVYTFTGLEHWTDIFLVFVHDDLILTANLILHDLR